MKSPGWSATSSWVLLPDGSDDQRDGAGGGVGIGDRQRDALGILREMHNDELSRLADGRDARRLNVQPRDVRA